MILPDERRLTGLVGAAFTPLRPDGSLNLAAIPAIVDRLERDGVVGVYILGSTGEGESLGREERLAVAEAYVRAATGRLATIVQVGHNSLAEARAFASHAQSIGADAISALPPSYFKPASEPVLVRCLASIAEGAPALPFYYYHIPPLTGVDPDMDRFLAEAERHLPTFAGIKFSDQRLHVLDYCLRYGDGKYDIVYGVDEMLLGALAMGVRGAVGSTYSFAAPLYRGVIESFERGDLTTARHLQHLANRMIGTIIDCCGRAGLKAAMSPVGPEFGPYRLPQETVDAAALVRLREELQAIGFFTWGRMAAGRALPLGASA